MSNMEFKEDQVKLAERFAKVILKMNNFYISDNEITRSFGRIFENQEVEPIIKFIICDSKESYEQIISDFYKSHLPISSSNAYHKCPIYYNDLTDTEMEADWNSRKNGANKAYKNTLIKNIESILDKTTFNIFKNRIYALDDIQNSDKLLSQLKIDIIMWVSRSTGIQNMNKCEVFYNKAITENHNIEFVFKQISEYISFYNSVKPD